MIWLDHHGYNVQGKQYQDIPATPHSVGRGFTGKLLVVDSGVMTQTFEIQLNVSQPETELLKASFTLCHTTPTFLDFVDQRRFHWDPFTGTDTPTHKFSTGVTFDSLSKAEPTDLLFDPLTYKFFLPERRFLVTIKLITNSKVLY